MPVYRYTIDGVETPWPGTLPPAPTPTPTPPTPTPLPSTPGCLNPVYNISVKQANPTEATPPYGNWNDVVLGNLPAGYAVSFFGQPPATWYDSPVPLVITGIDPGNPLNRPTYIPDPLDPSKPDICPTFMYEGTQLPGGTTPGVTVPPDTGTGTKPPDLPIIEDFDKPIVDDMNKCLNLVGDDLNRCLGVVTGSTDAVLDGVDDCVRRIPPKIGDQLINVMGQVYGVGVGCGLDVPTIDDIIEGNTGVGFPRIDPRPPKPTGDPVYNPEGDYPISDPRSPKPIGDPVYNPPATPSTPTPTPTGDPDYRPPDFPFDNPLNPVGNNCPAPVVQ
jgi:hypothetical protein